MNFRSLHRSLACVLSAVALAGLAWGSPAFADTLSGRAYAALVNAPTLGAGPLYVADTGELAPDGGWQGAGMGSTQVPDILSAETLVAATGGSVGHVASSTSLSDVSILPAQAAELAASFVRAEAKTTASGGSLGSAEIHDLTLAGQPISVTGQPNQKVEIPGVATLVINEQATTAEGITVNALHLILATGDEIIISSAKSAIGPSAAGSPPSSPSVIPLIPLSSTDKDCDIDRRQLKTLTWDGSDAPHVLFVHPQGEQPECIDFVTGGGFFMPRHAGGPPKKVNFGFNAGPRSIPNPVIKGHLNLVDHNDGTHVKGVNVDTYFAFSGDPDHCRMFAGNAEVNGIPGHRYQAGVCDYGEPGRDDRFQIRATLAGVEVYFADNHDPAKTCDPGEPFCGDLDGGNIQLHKPKCEQQQNGASAVFPGNRAEKEVIEI